MSAHKETTATTARRSDAPRQTTLKLRSSCPRLRHAGEQPPGGGGDLETRRARNRRFAQIQVRSCLSRKFQQQKQLISQDRHLICAAYVSGHLAQEGAPRPTSRRAAPIAMCADGIA
jgi:hypothetical protein